MGARRIVMHTTLCVAPFTALAFPAFKDFVLLTNNRKVVNSSTAHYSPLNRDRKVHFTDGERRGGAGGPGTGVAGINIVGRVIGGSVRLTVPCYWKPYTGVVGRGIIPMFNAIESGVGTGRDGFRIFFPSLNPIEIDVVRVDVHDS